MRLMICLTLTGVAAVGGCAGPAASRGGFDSPNPAARLYAIHQAGESGDAASVPKLVESLESDDPAERMMAIQALQRITGTRMGYRPHASPTVRREAVERWVAWTRQHPTDAAAVVAEK